MENSVVWWINNPSQRFLDMCRNIGRTKLKSQKHKCLWFQSLWDKRISTVSYGIHSTAD